MTCFDNEVNKRQFFIIIFYKNLQLRPKNLKIFYELISVFLFKLCCSLFALNVDFYVHLLNFFICLWKDFASNSTKTKCFSYKTILTITIVFCTPCHSKYFKTINLIKNSLKGAYQSLVLLYPIFNSASSFHLSVVQEKQHIFKSSLWNKNM